MSNWKTQVKENDAFIVINDLLKAGAAVMKNKNSFISWNVIFLVYISFKNLSTCFIFDIN